MHDVSKHKKYVIKPTLALLIFIHKTMGHATYYCCQLLPTHITNEGANQ